MHLFSDVCSRGGGTSSCGTTLAGGLQTNNGSSGGGSNPEGGLLAGTANMNRTLKYSSTHSSPLRSTLGFSSDWDQTRKHKTKDAVDSNGDTPVYPDDPLTPKYTLSVGDHGGCSD